jgi:hypothetical protein
MRSVLGHHDGGLARVAPVGLAARGPAIDGQAQRPGRAVAHSRDDLVRAGAARRHERLLPGPEHGRQPVGAQARVLAGAPVVQDRHLQAVVGVEPVGHPLGVLGVGEPVAGADAVAERLGRRPAAPAQRHLGRDRDLLAEVVAQPPDVRGQVRPVPGGLDPGGQAALQSPQLRPAAFLLLRRGELAGQVQDLLAPAIRRGQVFSPRSWNAPTKWSVAIPGTGCAPPGAPALAACPTAGRPQPDTAPGPRARAAPRSEGTRRRVTARCDGRSRLVGGRHEARLARSRRSRPGRDRRMALLLLLHWQPFFLAANLPTAKESAT